MSRLRMRKQTESSIEDKTKSDGLAAIAILLLTVTFIISIVVFAIA